VGSYYEVLEHQESRGRRRLPPGQYLVRVGRQLSRSLDSLTSALERALRGAHCFSVKNVTNGDVGNIVVLRTSCW
jgi:hypothetical protein